MPAVTATRGSGKFDVVPADAALGAEVRGVDPTTIDDVMFRGLHDLWLEHLLLVFRGQQLVAHDHRHHHRRRRRAVVLPEGLCRRELNRT